jgi:serine-type D-Ala-D-Ala carboxypeptidase (penicillin-binding protein 5/6)
MRLISVIMGAESERSRAQESQNLLNYGFRFFETHRLYAAGEPLQPVRLWQGAKPEISLGLEQPLYLTIPRGQHSNLKVAMVVNKPITAPVERGTSLGKLEIKLNEQLLSEQPLVALETVASGSLWQIAKDRVLQMLE